jgi:hypothetical protein
MSCVTGDRESGCWCSSSCGSGGDGDWNRLDDGYHLNDLNSFLVLVILSPWSEFIVIVTVTIPVIIVVAVTAAVIVVIRW